MKFEKVFKLAAIAAVLSWGAAAVVAEDAPESGTADTKIAGLKPNTPEEDSNFLQLDPKKGRPEKGGMGTLVVESQPAGGEVYYDGELLGKTPLTAKVKSGRSELNIMLDQQVLVHERINVWPNETTRRVHPLRLPIGTLKITTNPGKATIFLDGTQVGSTQGAELRIGKVKAGGHILRAESGGKTAIQQINVPAEDTLVVNLKLK